MQKLEEITFYNVNTDRRAVNGSLNAQAFPFCTAEKRHPHIFNTVVVPHLSTEVTSTVILFELTEDALNFFAGEAQLKNYYCLSTRYNLSPGSFHYLAISNKPFQAKIGLVYPLTESGFFYEGDRTSKEHLTDTYEEFEKSMFRVRSANGTLIFTTHLGLGNFAKVKQMEKIRQILLKVVPDNVKFVLGGDFNCFDRDVSEPKYLEGMFDILDKHFNRLTKDLTTTFDNRFFPYDIEHQLSTEKKAELSQLRVENNVENYRAFILGELEKLKTKGLALDHVYTNLPHDVGVNTHHAPHLSDHDALIVSIYEGL